MQPHALQPSHVLPLPELAQPQDEFLVCGISQVPDSLSLMHLCNDAYGTIPMRVQHFGDISVRPVRHEIYMKGAETGMIIYGWFRRRRFTTPWILRLFGAGLDRYEEIGPNVWVHVECFPDRTEGSKGTLQPV
jgi:hypothetical protein